TTPAFEAPFASPPRVEVFVSEEWSLEALKRAAELPNVSVVLATRTNMLRPEHALFLKRHRAGAVTLHAPLLQPHVEQLRKLPRTLLVFEVDGDRDLEALARVPLVGTQPVRVRAKVLTPALAETMSRLKGAVLELDLRSRTPEQDELALLARLRAQPTFRIAAGQHELVPGLALLKPRLLVVEADEDRLPKPLQDALRQAGIPVRVSVSAGVAVSDVARFSKLPGVELELQLQGGREEQLARVRRTIAGLSPEAAQ
ncbi:MAG: hypothetical protein ACK4N5_05675, partial [Myxococcales bacterium]